MKTTGWLGALLFLASIVYSQDIPVNQVPDKITNSFKQSFPKAKDTEWEKEGENIK